EPHENEVRLRVEAIGLNRAEVMFRTGSYLESPQFPARLGLEAAGVVDDVGAGVAGITVGDRVSTVPSFSMSSHGGYGESAIVPVHALVRYPSNLFPFEGASIWTAKKQILLKLGAAAVIASTEDLPEAVRRYTDGKGADLIFDAVAGSFLETL